MGGRASWPLVAGLLAVWVSATDSLPSTASAALFQGRELRRRLGVPGALRAAGFFEAAVAAAAPDAAPLELAQLLE